MSESMGQCWAQDLFHFFPSGAVTFTGVSRLARENGIPTWIWDIFREDIKPPVAIRTERFFFPGGNALGGYHQEAPYLLVGNPEYCKVNDEQLSTISGVAVPNIRRLPMMQEEKEITSFFHIDRYLTIVGKTSAERSGAEEKEIVLVAEVVGEAPEFAKALDALAEKIQMENFLTPVRLPCVVLPMGGESLVLSYNNCLVENYFEESSNNRILNFYVPDYTVQLKEAYDKLENEEERIELKQSIHKAAYDLFASNDFLNEQYPPLREELIAMQSEFRQLTTLASRHGFELKAALNNPLQNDFEMRLNLLTELTKASVYEKLCGLGANEVEFIAGDFRAEAWQGAGLHCMAKVLERDLVTLE